MGIEEWWQSCKMKIDIRCFCPRTRVGFVALGLVLVAGLGVVVAAEKRSPAPSFQSDQLRGVFFDKLDDALRGDLPSLSSLRGASTASTPNASGPTANIAASAAEGNASGWAKLVSPASLEDEVKRVRLRYDNGITTPGAFNGGGFQDARRDLSILATLFAVISEYNGDVRWKDQAGAARDLIARSAFNCKAGSTQVYNEAKLRKNDLEDLVSGSGLANRESEPQADWSMIVDRSPMMEYLEGLSEALQDASNSEASIKSNTETIKRQAELIAMVGQVLVKEGMDEADDKEYQKLSNSMTTAASNVASAIERGDLATIREAVGAITQSCDACHEQFR